MHRTPGYEPGKRGWNPCDPTTPSLTSQYEKYVSDGVRVSSSREVPAPVRPYSHRGCEENVPVVQLDSIAASEAVDSGSTPDWDTIFVWWV